MDYVLETLNHLLSFDQLKTIPKNLHFTSVKITKSMDIGPKCNSQCVSACNEGRCSWEFQIDG